MAILVIGWPWVGRRVRSWGYAERDDDLVVGSGIWFRRLVVVPYGRLQFVDVTRWSPLDRAFGLTSVQLHRRRHVGCRYPRSRPEVAAQLRDRLAARASNVRRGCERRPAHPNPPLGHPAGAATYQPAPPDHAAPPAHVPGSTAKRHVHR